MMVLWTMAGEDVISVTVTGSTIMVEDGRGMLIVGEPFASPDAVVAIIEPPGRVTVGTPATVLHISSKSTDYVMVL